MHPPNPVEVGFGGKCPRCGATTLFAGVARFAPRCRSCGLDFSAFNVGDGPAAFLTLVVGAIVTGLALMVDRLFAPPFWVHLLLWVPITLILVLGSLRVSKAMLLALEFRHKAIEGRIEPPAP